MRIIPAIDIIDGKCVRLTKGDYSTKKIYNENPLEVAKEFEDNGIQYSKELKTSYYEFSVKYTSLFTPHIKLNLLNTLLQDGIYSLGDRLVERGDLKRECFFLLL